MNLFKMISATALSTALMLAMASGVNAQTSQEQSLETNSDVRVECTSGSYGQNLNCTVDASSSARGNQSQVLGEVVYRADGTPVRVHQTANTALDFNTLVIALGTIATGGVGAALKITNRA